MILSWGCLAMTEIDIQKNLCEITRPKADCPWRRFFARSIDSSIIMLLWYAVAYLGFHWNITGRVWLDSIISLAVMILLEPPVLAIFGTTPGKAIFGIRVTNPGGKRLTLLQGFARVWGVFSRGYGYSIPIYNIVRQYKCYKECKEYGEMEWDEGLEYTVRDRKPIRLFIFALCTLALTAVTVLIPYAADMPKHRGELTAQQFSENMNRSLRYNSVEGGTGLLPPERKNALAAVSYNPQMLPPEISLVESNGAVTEVTMAIANITPFDFYEYSKWIDCGVNAFVGAQKEMNLFRMHFGEVRKNMPSYWAMHDSYSYVLAGVEVTYNIEIDGHPMSDRQYYFDHATDASVVNAYFTMRVL